MSISTPIDRRRRFQFRIWHLFYVMTMVAGYLALMRLEIGTSGLIVFLGSELLVVVMGTAIFVERGQDPQLANMVVRGTLAGSCLAAICIGWIPTLISIVFLDLRPIVGLIVIAALGGALGSLIGLFLWWLRRSRMSARQPSLANMNVKLVSVDPSWLRSTIGEDSSVTDRVKLILRLAGAAAHGEQCQGIEPRHLLLAIAEEGRGVGAYVLKQLNVSLSDIRRASWITRAGRPGGPYPPLPVLPLTESSKAVLRDAELEAQKLGHDFIGSEHLLLSLASELGTTTFAGLGLTAERMRRETLAVLGIK